MKIYTKIVFDMSDMSVVEEESFDYEGPLELCGGGGGGSAGSISYSSTITTPWLDFLGGVTNINDGVYAIVNTATGVGGNPFTGETSFDPNAALTLTTNSPLKNMQDRHDSFDTLIGALDEEVDWNSMIDKVIAELDAGGSLSETDITATVAAIMTTARSDNSSIIADAVTAATTAMASANVSSAVTAFESENTARRMRVIARTAAGMAGINAVNSSAFVMAAALAEFEFTKEDTRFQENLKMDIYKESLRGYVSGVIEKFRAHLQSYIQNHLAYEELRTNMINNAVQAMTSMKNMIVSANSQATAMQAELSRMAIVAMKEKVDRQLQIDEGDMRWDLEMTLQGTSAIGMLAGATAALMPARASTAQSAIGGAMSGAATGALAGSVIPGIGTAAGAIIGGVGGLLSGIL